jgi:membrane-associated phospholipid phosphatase
MKVSSTARRNGRLRRPGLPEILPVHSWFRLHHCTLGVLLALTSLSAAAQQNPQRLSAWLVQNDPTATAYLQGLSWRVPEEVPAQLGLKLELLQALADTEKVGRVPTHNQLLAELISGMPVTGRVPIAVVDARWLEAHPARDPVLLPGHKVDLPERPRTVTVLTSAGVLCRVEHVADQEAGSYVKACADSGAAADWAWVAQPDGRVERYGIAMWNRQPQDFPAPGAWIWAPPRNAGWPEWFSQKLITFLSYQGLAPDRGAAAVVKSADKTAVTGGAAEGLHWSAAVNGLVDPLPQQPVPPERQTQIPQVLLQRERSLGLPVTASDWGSVGLLQTPSARMRDVGSFSLSFNRVEPYTRMNFFFQPFKWMEAGFRYSSIGNRNYQDGTPDNPQTYKDKGFDVKFTLWDESAYVPAIAVGFRDVAGTGLFSGEHVVASKRYGNFDASFGLGWGNLAGNIRSPTTSGQGGEFQFGNYFSGTARPFGGVQWHSPWSPLLLKAEYDSNDYQNEPLVNRFEQKSKFNFGATYRLYSWLDLTAGYERGNTLSVGLSLHTDLSKLSTPKLNDPPRVPVAVARPQTVPDWTKTATDIIVQTNWNISQIKTDGDQLTVTVNDPRGVYWQDRVDRAASVLHRDAPAAVDRFVLRYQSHGINMAEQMVDRQEWVAAQVQPQPPSQQTDTVLARAAGSLPEGAVHFDTKSAPWNTNFRIGYSQSFGAPDNFLNFQVYAQGSARMTLGRPNTWVTGVVRLNLLDNYEEYTPPVSGNLPRVRTNVREYVTASALTMPNLQVTHVEKLSENHYASVYAGYLEEMFAGMGGEWMYRPFASRFAFGIDANYVQQRDFSQNFDMLNPKYRVATGHATGYWDTGWNGVELRGSAGRYLAGDIGVTAEVSRRFSNGVLLGAYATKTNVSAQDFGEGSFDKGIFLSIPFDAMFTKSSTRIASLDWKPLTRDGGARLSRSETLYDVTRTRDLRLFEFKSAPPPNAERMPADHQPNWQPEKTAPAAYTVVVAKENIKQWTADSDASLRLARALDQQGFRNVVAEFDQAHRLNLKVAHDNLQPLSRAVGRAARTALNLAPLETRELRIQFAERVEPIVEYDFFDLKRLGRHLSGELPAAALKDVTAVRYINPGAREADPLAGLADVSVATQIPAVNDVKSLVYYPSRVISDFGDAATQVGKVDWLRFAGIGLAAVAGSSILDDKGLSFAKDYANSSWLKGLNKIGDAVPWVGFVGAGLFALDGSDPRRSRTGYAAVEAGLSSVVVSAGLKYAIGRPRPNSGISKWDMEPLSGSPYDSMPSNHTALAWAVATPFALEYRAPWLYGVAALTNLSRIGKQEHWFSDTVASSVIGYGLGRLFWESARGNTAMPQVFVDPTSVNFAWKFY